MHILVVTQYYWPENFRINDLTIGLVEHGHQVTVLTGIPNYPEGQYFNGYGLFKKQRQEYKGVQIIRVPLIPRGGGRGVRLAVNYLSFTISACLCMPLLISKKFDLIFICQLSPITVALPALLLKKMLTIPAIMWVLDLWPESLTAINAVKSKLIIKKIDQLVRFIYRHCDRIIVASDGFIPSICEKGIEPKKIGSFPNWYEPEYRKELNKELPLHITIPEGFVVMFAGNIGSAQSFETILSAAENTLEFADIHWVIVGNGRQAKYVKAEVSARNLSRTVHLLGSFSPDFMPAFFARADVMLVTLKRDPIFSLTIPGKIQSYLACGKPIVASLDGEGGQLIEKSGAGLVCRAEDPNGLANAILALYRMPPEQRQQMGLKGKLYCEENFNRDMLLNRLDDWMKEVAIQVDSR